MLRFLTGLFLFLGYFATGLAYAEKRLALVVGINDYVEVPKLEKAIGDGAALAEKLTSLGFQVSTVFDPDRRTLNQALSKLYESIEPGDTVVVHYSGHGIEIDGQNYLLPRDIPAPASGQAELVKAESVTLSSIDETLAARGAGVRLMIIDACRDNPFAQKGLRSLGGKRGLANMVASEGSFIMYSAGAGQAALDRLGDSDQSPTSVYMRVLLTRLDQPNVKLRDLAASVREDVDKLAKSVGHDQRPAYYDDLPADFVFVKAAVAETEKVEEPVVPQPPPPQPSKSSGLSDEKAYQLAESINTVDGWTVFIEQFPDSAYTAFAVAQRDKLIADELARKAEALERKKKAEADAKAKAKEQVAEADVTPEKPAGEICAGSGRVTGLNPDGDNFLSVRTGPGVNFTEITRIFTGDRVTICGKSGKWLKVKFSGGRGWVHGRYIAR